MGLDWCCNQCVKITLIVIDSILLYKYTRICFLFDWVLVGDTIFFSVVIITVLPFQFYSSTKMNIMLLESIPMKLYVASLLYVFLLKCYYRFKK